MYEREKSKKISGIFLTLLFAVFLTLAASAGQPSAHARAASKKRETWVERSNGKVVYYDKNGEKAKGLVKINGKKYYFDKKGIQRTGWQEIDGNYYYFRIKSGKKGYMLKSQKVNGIKLRKSGKAKVTGNEKKLRALVLANQVVEKYTTPLMTKKQKLKAVWNHLLDSNYYTYKGSKDFVKYENWDAVYALQVLDKPHMGACYAYGAAFAYLANACGYTATVVSSGGHGWCEIGNYVYDPTWQLVYPNETYFRRPLGLTSGPAYQSADAAGAYKVTI